MKQEKCTVCDRGRSETPFPAKGGTCKECVHEKQAAYRATCDRREYDRDRYMKKGEQIRAQVRQYARANSDKVSMSKKNARAKNPDKYLDKDLKWRYGLSLEEFRRLEAAQGGVCAICHEPPSTRLYVDHDHVSGRIRGLLCQRCNVMLGHAKDNVLILESAITYLQRKSNE